MKYTKEEMDIISEKIVDMLKEKEEMQRLLEEYAALQQDDHPEN